MDGASWHEICSSSVIYFESNRRNWRPQVVAKFLNLAVEFPMDSNWETWVHCYSYPRK